MTAPTSTPERRERVESLDALRGVLAIGVMVYHLLLFRYDVALRSLGTYAVYTFFVLSGFAMRWTATPPPGEPFPLRPYAAARLARIVPLWWAAVIGTVVSALPTRPDLGQLVENLTLVVALTPTTDIPLGGWSIEIEIVFYLLFPVFAMLLRTTRSLVALLVVAVPLRFAYVLSGWPSGRLGDPVHYQQIPTFLVFFAGGMLLAELRRGRSPHSNQLPLVGTAAVLVAVFATGGLDRWTILAGPLSLALTAGCIVAVGCAAWAPNPTGRATRWLSATLGAISYAVYLLHPIVYSVVNRVGAGDAMTVAATIVGSLVAAWCSYRWFEVPVGRWVRSRLTPAPPARA